VAAGDAQSEQHRQLVMFSLHGEHYALPIGTVREIIRYTPPRVTAAARGLIQGLINLRGKVLPVVDLSSRLGQVLEVTDSTRILVTEVANGVVGLIVDVVDGVVEVAADRVEPIPGADADDALGDEIAAIDDKLVMLIDPDRALGQVLAAAPARDAGETTASDEPANANPGPSARAPEPRRAPRPSGPPPARRRSAATPQMPRSRRRPGHTKDSEE
jgi:purine-binding chemotaxis protein CheW